ncbi:hypothetical protein PPL_08853 [Heterostelium album PN500]|uniref:Polyketide synthase n=1 Tax=Heterostelium pallidum (strain ATCC 26659 / Pp 5 / PN500) TaxID=670386 RepID=D3BJX3_HETP5|nr:hypothetical protein PPL_08853 [Heterostelium album PN500]EFA78203.1 hypothetical protein PPL_08853 [Heterostelium album PN500]|eukprot:XP_020430329.1 hypothetical protein PPL_08853 [Heterostelium album PN500]
MVENNSQNSKIDIAIIGIGIRLPGKINSPEQFWNALQNSFDGVVKIPKERWSEAYHQHRLITNDNAGLLELDEWKKFDPLFFEIAPKDAPVLDPQERMLLTLTYEALEDAQIPSKSLSGSNTGVFVGVSTIDYHHLNTGFSPSYPAPKVLCDFSTHSVMANRVSYCFDFRGPSMCIDTACSSSLTATDLAIKYIQDGECDISLVCGINALFDPEISKIYSNFGVLGDQCRSFDADAKGFVKGEGCGVVVLKKLSNAERDGNRIYSVIKGRGINTDGHSNKDTISTPSNVTQSQNIKLALQRSNIDPSEIYYVEAHSTGTVVGDPIEVQALIDVFAHNHTPERPLKIGSVKTNIGHLESGAGVASLIKVSLMLKHRKLVPSIKMRKLNPKIPFLESNIQVVTQVEDLPNDRLISMGINSFGIGGSNSHIILQEYRDEYKFSSLSKDSFYHSFLIPITANSSVSIDRYIESIKEYQNRISLKEFALYQSITKSFHSKRKVIIAKDWIEFNSQLIQFNGQTPSLGKKLIYVFCGQGPQWNEMGMNLYQNEPIYRSIVDKLDKMFQVYSGYSILDKMKQISNQSTDIHKPILAQPSLFIFQVALVELYKHWGLNPSIVLGHSFGEMTSAYVSGNISLDESVKLVYLRAIFQNETVGSGKMLVVGISADKYKNDFQNQFPALEIACYNSEQSIVVTGNEEKLNELVKQLKIKEIFNSFLRSQCSFHSKHQEVIKDKVIYQMKVSNSERSRIPWYSTFTGELKIDPIDSQYIYDSLRYPVYFQKTLQSIERDIGRDFSDYVFLEISPHPTLISLIKETLPSSKIISPIQRNRDEQLLFKSSLAELHCLGVNIRFQTQFNTSDIKNPVWRDNVSILPRYQWDNELYWNESHHFTNKKTYGPTTSILGNPSFFNGNQCFLSEINIGSKPYQYLKDHQVKSGPLFPGAAYIEAIIESMSSNKKDILNNDYFDESEEWLPTAKSKVTLLPSSTSKVLDFESYRNKCNWSSFTSEELYKKTHRLGLKYGPAFQHIKLMLVGDKMSFSILNVRSSTNAPSKIFNCTLLDNCAHGLLGIIDDRRQYFAKSIEMVINYQSISEVERNPPDELYLLSRVIDSTYNDIIGHCQLVHPNGTLILEMTKLTVGTNEKSKMKKIKYPVEELMDSFYQSKESILKSPKDISLRKVHTESSLGIKVNDFEIDSIRLLYSMFSNILLDFNLSILDQTIKESFVKFSLVSSNTNIKLFSRIIEILKENRSILESFEEKDFKETWKYSIPLCHMEQSVQSIIDVLYGNFEVELDNQYQNDILEHYIKQIINIAVTSISETIINSKELRIIKILEIGRENGKMTKMIISQLDEMLLSHKKNNIQVQYTFTNASPTLVKEMKERFTNQFNLKSNLKLKFKVADFDRDFIEQDILHSSYDMVLMSLELHIRPDIRIPIENCYNILSPNGILLFVEPAHSVASIDILFGRFKQYWNYIDGIRDHSSPNLNQLVELLSQNNRFINTKIYGPIDSNGNQLPPDQGLLNIIHSQKSPIKSLPICNIQHLVLIINENQSIPLEIFEQYSKKSISIVYSNEIDHKSGLLFEASHIIFLSTIEQQYINTFQTTLFSLVQLIQTFRFRENQPSITIITKDSESSNFFSNSVVGLVYTAMVDHRELNLLLVDIDSPLNGENIETILRLNENRLGEYHYSIKKNQVMVSRIRKIKDDVLEYSHAFENEIENLGVAPNVNLDFKLMNRIVGPNEIEIEVKSAAINFKDYLFHLKLIPEKIMIRGDIHHPPLGLESSGVVTKIGENTKKFKVGDEVVCFQIGKAIGSHTIYDESFFVPKPKELSFIECSSVGTVYLSVYHAFKITNFDAESESILIHSATGGVGLAALNTLRMMNCKRVFATAGSQEKIEYLKSNYSDILIDVFNSSSIGFADLIKQKCNGVDVLLNSLSVEYMEENFRSMAPHGRIADLTITHIHNNDTCNYGQFKNDLIYCPIDLTFTAKHKTIYMANLFKQILNDISTGKLQLTPIKVFDITDIKDAFKLMKDRKQIGKIVLDCSNIKNSILQPLVESKNRQPLPKIHYKVPISNTIIVTGQSGISLELVTWLSKHSSASNIVVFSKSNMNNRIKQLINSTTSMKIDFYSMDVSNFENLNSSIETISKILPPIETIFHLATIFGSNPINEVTLENLKEVNDPKVIGAYNLHKISIDLKLPLKQFIVFSSVSGLCGSASQPAYNSACLTVDALCKYRNNILGLCSKSIRLGPTMGEGTVAESEGMQEYFNSRGVEPCPLNKVIGGIEQIISQSLYCTPIISNITNGRCYDVHPHIRQCVEHLVVEDTGKSNNLLDYVDPIEAITDGLSKLLSIPNHKLNHDTPLKNYGVDSMVTVQVKFYLDNIIDIDVFSLSQIPNLTINSIHLSYLKLKKNKNK